MPRRRTLIEHPHKAIHRAIEAHGRIGAPQPADEAAAAAGEQAAEPSSRSRTAAEQKRDEGGKFA